jgi:hypothetical protein
MPFDEAQPSKLFNLAALDALGEVIAELVQGLHHREPCQAGHHALLPDVPAGGFFAQQPFQEVAVRHLLFGCLLARGAVALRDERQV